MRVTYSFSFLTTKKYVSEAIKTLGEEKKYPFWGTLLQQIIYLCTMTGGEILVITRRHKRSSFIRESPVQENSQKNDCRVSPLFRFDYVSRADCVCPSLHFDTGEGQMLSLLMAISSGELSNVRNEAFVSLAFLV